MLNRLRSLVSQGAVWPEIDYELIGPKARGLLKGEVLNAGAGTRDFGHLIEGNLTNQDIRWGPEDERTYIDIFAPIHEIPRPEGFFDTVLCIAVLEHVANPTEVVAEFHRVLKRGGSVVASVPFLQPEHKAPTDFQRYTRDGLSRLFETAGFQVTDVVPIFTVYHTLHWIVWEWLELVGGLRGRVGKAALMPPLLWLAKRSHLTSDKLASVFQIVAQKT